MDTSQAVALPASDCRRQLRIHLARGLPAVLLCDTIYGLVALPSAADRLKELKRRDGKPFIHLLGSFEQLRRLSRQPLPEGLRRCWPGPLSCVLRTTLGDIAVRVPASLWLRRLINELAQPLLSTSVNLSGRPALHCPRAIAEQFIAEDLLIVDSGVSQETVPSTLVDARTLPLRVLRLGAMDVRRRAPELFRMSVPSPFEG